MRVAMPIESKSMEGNVSLSFARAPYFMIYDTESKEGNYLDNSAATSQGGAGIKAAQIIVDNNIDILLTPRCGENAANVIKEANIKMYKTVNGSAKNNIDAFNEDQLSLLEEIHAGFHHGAK